MALARLCMKNSERLPGLIRSHRPLFGPNALVKYRDALMLPCLAHSSSSAAAEGGQAHADDQCKDISTASETGTITDSGPRNRRRRGRLWREPWEIFPFHFNTRGPQGRKLSNALMQLSENLNNVLGNLPPFRMLRRRVKEDDECYKLRLEVPGLSKDDIKVTIEDGFLVVTGERKEEEESSDEGEGWFSQVYGYYNTSLLLPEDAKVEGIKAELKNGVLHVTVPRSGEKKKREVHQIEIQ